MSHKKRVIIISGPLLGASLRRGTDAEAQDSPTALVESTQEYHVAPDVIEAVRMVVQGDISRAMVALSELGEND